MVDWEKVMEALADKMENSDKGEDAEGFANAAKTIHDMNTDEWRETVKEETERKKNRAIFWAAVITGAATVAVPIIRGLMDIRKVDTIAYYENNENTIVNTRKYN